MKKNNLLYLFFILISTQLGFAQTQGTAYTAVGKGVATTFLTDYHSLGINSSSLGWGTGYEDKHFTMGMTEFSFGISSPTLDKQRIKNAYKGIMGQVKGDAGDFDYKQQLEAAGDYAEAGLGIRANYNWFGASYQSEKFGGIAVSISENYEWFSQLNKQTTDIIFRGQFSNLFDSLTIAMNGDTTNVYNSGNISEDTLNAAIGGIRNSPLLISDLTRGSKIKFLWSRHYNVGYGRKIIGDPEEFALYGGIGFRYIQSVAMFDMESDDDGLRANTAMSPFFQINQDGERPSNKGFFPESVGSGYGVDLSVSAILFGKLRLAAAVNNIGQVTYKSNVYTFRDTLFGNYSLSGLTNADVSQSAEELLDINGLLNMEKEQKVTVTNAANFRIGGSLALFEDKLQFGFDLVAPFNKNQPGSMQNAVFSFGGEIRPVKWLQLNLGYFGGGVYKHNLPVGINFVLGGGTYEFGIASQDAISFFYKGAHSISMAMGIARFRF